MSNFWKPDYNGRYTSEELDTLALKGEPIDGMGYGYKCRPDGDALESEHYCVRTINTQGMGNHGSVVLIGKTPHGRKMVRRGKIARLMAEGCSERVARAAVCTKYGMEGPVWALAEEILPMVERGMVLRSTGHRDFQETTGISDYKCSFPRVCAAVEIAERVCGVSQNFTPNFAMSPAIDHLTNPADERALVNSTFARVLRAWAAKGGNDSALIAMGARTRSLVADYCRGRGPFSVLGSQDAAAAIAADVLGE